MLDDMAREKNVAISEWENTEQWKKKKWRYFEIG